MCLGPELAIAPVWQDFLLLPYSAALALLEALTADNGFSK